MIEGTKKPLHPVWKILHGVIIVNFAVQIAYGGYMVFVVVAPESAGPLMDQATSFPFEKMMTRRLYASETWIAIVGLSLYLAITEIAPRLNAARG
jgi:hypothetical protein